MQDLSVVSVPLTFGHSAFEKLIKLDRIRFSGHFPIFIFGLLSRLIRFIMYACMVFAG